MNISDRLIIFSVPPAATLRDQDVADLELFKAGLEWREGAGLTGPDEFGPCQRSPDLEFLVKILERTATRRPETDRLWADIFPNLSEDDCADAVATAAEMMPRFGTGFAS
jgi:hypothetical protein